MFLLLIGIVHAASNTCVGQLYYRPNCETKSLDVISANATECGAIRTGLQSVKLQTGKTAFVDICGQQALTHCAVVDADSNVFLGKASGVRPNGVCDTAQLRFLTNLCGCPLALDQPCVNSQYFKVADCRNAGPLVWALAAVALLGVLI